MKNYRLKPIARVFFGSKFITESQPLSWWKDNGITMDALEESKAIQVTVGHKNGTFTDISSYDYGKYKAILRFDLNLECNHKKYELLKENVAGLVASLEAVANVYYDKLTEGSCDQ